MKAAVFKGVVELNLENLPEPQVKPNEVKVKIMLNTICNSTDRKILHGLRDEGVGVNNIIGHESGGVVVEVGSLVEGFEIGDRVACDEWGTYTEFICTKAENLVKVPDNMTWDEISLAEIVMKVYQMSAQHIIPGDTVVILGQGPAGMIFTQMAKLCGASKVVVTDLSDMKLKKSLEDYGADVAINAENKTNEDMVNEINSHIGSGADVVIEAAGVVDTGLQALQINDTYGVKIMQFGVIPYLLNYDFAHLHDRGKQILTMGSCRFVDTHRPFHRAVKLIAEGKIEVASFITHRFKLDQINQAFSLVETNPKEVIKIAIDN
jgi:2-desacetyl-2-hydroxyethyl bacteriochlorophyllide A dehydrogenase